MNPSYLFSHDGLHDGLTHVYAPPFIYDAIDKGLKASQRSGLPITVIEVTVIHGQEEIRDSAIIDCAELLRRTSRPDDLVGRIGIVDFIIILSPTRGYSEDEIDAIRSRINDGWDGPVALDLKVQTSIEGEELTAFFARFDG